MTTQSPADADRHALPLRPVSVGAVRRPGLVPQRLLMFGSGVLTGEGLTSHDLGLPGAVADALASRSPRGADITVVVDPDPLSRRALEGLRGLRLGRFDAVIVVLGPAAGTRKMVPARRGGGLQRLAELLATECGPDSAVFVYDSGPAMAGVSGSGTSALSLGGGIREPGDADPATRVRFRELPPQPAALGPASAFSSVTYQGWADLIVERLNVEIADRKPPTVGAASRAAADLQDEETLRLEALGTLRLSAAEPEEQLGFLLRQAKVAFATAGAALAIVGQDWVWPHLTVGDGLPVLRRDLALSNLAIQSERPTVISDTQLDPRVPASGSGDSTDPVRFYAAYPIHTWDGYRIGALCIYDTTPREARITDLVQLWEIAGQIEQHLWNAALRSGSGDVPWRGGVSRR